MAESPEYLQVIRERDAAVAERDEARAALGRLVDDLEELVRKHELSVILPTFSKAPIADPPPESPPSMAEPPAGRVFGKPRGW
jgi:hypothetical protein